MRNWKSLCLAGAAFLASAPAQAAPAAPALPDADPAIWVVKDPDTTIYLFGTFHGLDNTADWFNDEVKTAFDASNELVIEALIPEDPAELQKLVSEAWDGRWPKDLDRETVAGRARTPGQGAQGHGRSRQCFRQTQAELRGTALASTAAAKMGYRAAKWQ